MWKSEDKTLCGKEAANDYLSAEIMQFLHAEQAQSDFKPNKELRQVISKVSMLNATFSVKKFYDGLLINSALKFIT